MNPAAVCVYRLQANLFLFRAMGQHYAVRFSSLNVSNKGLIDFIQMVNGIFMLSTNQQNESLFVELIFCIPALSICSTGPSINVNFCFLYFITKQQQDYDVEL